MTEFDLQALLQALADRAIRFVIIGGVAVGAHGYVRATADLDIVPDPDPENLNRLIDVLRALGATLPSAGNRKFNPAEDAKVVRRGGNVTADTELGSLDVIQLAIGVPTYSQLANAAVESDVLGVPVRVCSLGDLREMKQAQGRAQDEADLANLPDSD